MNDFMLTDTSIIEDQDNSRAFYPFYVGIDIGSDFHVAACIPFEKSAVRRNGNVVKQ
ncbi:hypothetical protein WGM54_06675 [Paenibacillus polymyxa]|uniref:hypothetical protein n=1 Tax=Paenibacillus polymyxa TaxID=1406 RepID=UPI00307E50EA